MILSQFCCGEIRQERSRLVGIGTAQSVTPMLWTLPEPSQSFGESEGEGGEAV